jgi:hypothetical protein
MKSIFYALLFSVMFFSLNCYTVVERNRTLQIESSKYLNHEIVSTWASTAYYADAPNQTKIIEFQPDGDVLFYPRYPGDAYAGSFEIKDNLLEVKLLYNSDKEIFKYSINGASLKLQKINAIYHPSISLVDGKSEIYQNKNYKILPKIHTR